MTGRFVMVLGALFLLFAAHPAQAQASADDGVIGTIVDVQGSTMVTSANGGTAKVAVADMPVHLNDTVQTGIDSRMFVLFIDNTELTLSENTQIKIDSYVYDPDDNKDNSALYSVLQGAFQYTSGLIGKKEHPDVSINTPVGALGIRGTDFWAGELDGQYSVAVNEGQVVLKTDAGEEVVNGGEGTSVKGRRFRPDRAKAWGREKLERIAATVHLKRREWIRQRITAMQGRQQELRQRYKEHMKAKHEMRQEQRQQRLERRGENLRDRRALRKADAPHRRGDAEVPDTTVNVPDFSGGEMRGQ
jgi:hypothetical protein